MREYIFEEGVKEFSEFGVAASAEVSSAEEVFPEPSGGDVSVFEEKGEHGAIADLAEHLHDGDSF